MSERPPRLTSRRPGLPPQVDRVFARALAKAPHNRYTTCQGFADALREALGLEPYHLASDAVPAAERSQAEITWAPGSESEKLAVPADAAGTDLADPVPGLAGAVNIQASTTITSGQRHTQPGFPGGEARRRRRRRRIASAAISILAAAAVVATILASPLGHEPAKPPSHASGKRPSYQIMNTLTAPMYSAVFSVAFSPDGKTLATGTSRGPRGRTYLWDVATGRRTATLTHPGSDSAGSVAFSPDGKTLATGASSGPRASTYLWDVVTRRRTATLASPGNTRTYSVAFSPDGKTLAIGNDNGTYLWEVAARRLIAILPEPGSPPQSVLSVAFSPNGKVLAALVLSYQGGGNRGRVDLWNVATRHRIATLTGPRKKSFVQAMAFSPDGQTLATGGIGRAYLWNVATRRLIATLTIPSSLGVTSLAFSPDGKTLAAADGDGRTYLWDVAAKRLIQTLANPGSHGVYSVAFSPDGKTLATGDGNSSTYLWHTH